MPVIQQEVYRYDRRGYHEYIVLTGIAYRKIDICGAGGKEHSPNAFAFVARKSVGDLFGEDQRNNGAQHQKQLGIRKHKRRAHDRLVKETLDYPYRQVPNRPRQHAHYLAAHMRVMYVVHIVSGVSVKAARIAVGDTVPNVGGPYRKALQIPGRGRHKHKQARNDSKYPLAKQHSVAAVHGDQFVFQAITLPKMSS